MLQTCTLPHLPLSTPYPKMSTCSIINSRLTISSHLFNQMVSSYICLICQLLHHYSGHYIALQDISSGPHHMAFIMIPPFRSRLRVTFHRSTLIAFTCSTLTSSAFRKIMPSIHSVDILLERILQLGTATSKQWDDSLFNGFKQRDGRHFSWGPGQGGIGRHNMALISSILSAISSLAIP